MLLDPNRFDPAHLDAETRRLLKATVDWFEARGKRQLIADAQDKVWYAEFLDFVKQEKLFATICTPGAVRRRRRPLGHRPHRRVQRDPRLLRPAVLVHLAGLGARPRPDLDERERGGQAEGGRPARRRRHLRVRPLREGARRGHLLDRHDRHARPTSGYRRRTAASTTSATATTPASSRVFGKLAGSDEYVFFAVDSPARELRAASRTSSTARSSSPSSRLDDYP